jgi:uncharacterized membrane protein
MTLPTWPGWDGLHPLVIHFPIALLMVAPLFVLLALVLRRSSVEFSRTALVLLALGTVATWVAISTGKAAGELAEHTDAINAVISQHEELAETTRNLFTVLTLLYAVVVFAPGPLRRLRRPALAFATNAVFLVALAGATLLVVATAHQGGRLVHQLGVHALMPGPPPPVADAER